MKKLRQEFAETMIEMGPNDPNLVVMVGDISHGILKPFASLCPGRYYNIGICEPTMVNMAAGLSKLGLIPVVHTIAPFLIERSYEQIKLDFGYQKLGVNLVSVGGSFDYSQLGCSHHCYSDISILSHLKNSVLMLPSSPIEFNELFKQNYSNLSINYFRLTENAHGIEFSRSDIRTGKAIKIKEGKNLTIVALGPQLKNAISLSSILSASGITCDILYYHTFKPFDNEIFLESIKKTKFFISLEELSSHGGIFSKCIEASYGLGNINAKQFAIDDFIHGYGTYDELSQKAGLEPGKIANEVLNEIKD